MNFGCIGLLEVTISLLLFEYIVHYSHNQSALRV